MLFTQIKMSLYQSENFPEFRTPTYVGDHNESRPSSGTSVTCSRNEATKRKEEQKAKTIKIYFFGIFNFY